ncbi:MAG: TfoX/Sxy family protein [Patescibacteria group bacterium]
MKSSASIDYLKEEVFRDISGLTYRPMFGGVCIYKDGVACGMLADDILYFKVGDNNRPDYEAAGSKPFEYSMKGKTYKMSYWEVPQEVLDDSDKLKVWLKKSLETKK